MMKTSHLQAISVQTAMPADSEYDCIVIGAGVAGSLAAYLLSQAGQTVLLVDAKSFPRDKVCGSCLNQRGQNVLRRANLLDQAIACGGKVIDTMELRLQGRTFRWTIPPMLSTQRSTLDAMLVDEVRAAGGVFLDATRAFVLPVDDADPRALRTVELRTADENPYRVSGRLVLVADGLTQSSLARLPQFQSSVDGAAHIGLQTWLPRELLPTAMLNQLTMLASQRGYVGFAAVDGGKIDLAAAIDPKHLATGSKPWEIVAAIVRNCRVELSEDFLENAKWLATPQLTRKSTLVGSHRLLLLGDSLGYVEPFTGEGMSWALRSAELVRDLAIQAIDDWSEQLVSNWEHTLRQQLYNQQWFCRQFSRILRHPAQSIFFARIANQFPAVRNWALQKVSVQ